MYGKKIPTTLVLSIPQHSHFPELSRKKFMIVCDHTKNCNSCKTTYFNLNALQLLIPSSLALFFLPLIIRLAFSPRGFLFSLSGT